MCKVLETTKFVVDNSQFIKIDKQKISEFADNLNYEAIDHWLSKTPFDFNILDTDKEKLHFLFLLNSISFSYWGDPKWIIEYRGEKYDGAMGMVAALTRAMEKGIPILDFSYLSNIDRKDLEKILRANTQIPFFENRLEFLRANGKIIIDKFHGELKNLIDEAGGDAIRLLKIIINEFSSFRDISIYKEKEIFFLKRAQLFISDVYEMFNGMSFGNLQNIEQLTACADYKLPQILRKLGIFIYNKNLSEKVDNKIEISHNSEEEIEIRANTIWAIELIKKTAQKRIPNIKSTEINDYLWLLSQSKLHDDKPYHRTRTTAY